jgi:hypothetical protein
VFSVLLASRASNRKHLTQHHFCGAKYNMKSNSKIISALGLIESSKNSQSGRMFCKNGAGCKKLVSSRRLALFTNDF